MRLFFATMVMAAIASGGTIISVAQNNSIVPWGVPGASTYGQTVIAPNDLYLDSFTFYLGPPFYFGPPFSGSGPIEYQAEVYVWSAPLYDPTGSALFTSGATIYTPGADYTPVTFDPNVPVVAGESYVLFLTTAGFQSGASTSQIHWGFNDLDPYTQGNAVYQYSGNDTTQITTAQWTIAVGDFAFSADFENSTIPEPTSMNLLGTGLFALGLGVFRNRQIDSRRAIPRIIAAPEKSTGGYPEPK